MSDAVIIGVSVAVLICVTLVLVAVIVSKAQQRTLAMIESMHKSDQQSLDKTLDRLMTIRWEDFVSVQSYETDDEGGFISPEEQKAEAGVVTIEEPGQWGALEKLRRRSEAQENEDRLLREDFPDERQASA